MEHLKRNSGKYEWYTPRKIARLAHQLMGGIDLDPASCAMANELVGAAEYFDIEMDGLQREWRGRVWLNPPYARLVIDKWIDKLIAECRAGRVVEWMVLVNNASDTKWAHRLFDEANGVCFLKGRIRFETPDGGGQRGPLQGQMLAVKLDEKSLHYFRQLCGWVGSVWIK